MSEGKNVRYIPGMYPSRRRIPQKWLCCQLLSSLRTSNYVYFIEMHMHMSEHKNIAKFGFLASLFIAFEQHFRMKFIPNSFMNKNNQATKEN